MANQHRTPSGRYAHDWGWQGFDEQGREWADCQVCGSWAINGRFTSKTPTELRPSPDAWVDLCPGCGHTERHCTCNEVME